MSKATPKGKGLPVWVWVAAGLVVVVGYWYGHRVGDRASEAELAAAETGIPMQPYTQPGSYQSFGANPYGTGAFNNPWVTSTGGGGSAGDDPTKTGGVPPGIPGGAPGPVPNPVADHGGGGIQCPPGVPHCIK